jgi:endonuclease YncB( thermonuclease family)
MVWQAMCTQEVMAEFNVVHVVDGDTFDVSPGWQWNGNQGNRVRPTGYDAPEMYEFGGQAAKDWLARLLLNKTVTLGKAYKLDHGRLVCDVFFQGKSLADWYTADR